MNAKSSPVNVSSSEKLSKDVAVGIAVQFTSRIGSTCDLGAQTVELTPGACSCCGSGCCCSSCCSW